MPERGAGGDGSAPARAMSAADAWKPGFDRRQSWSKEDQKHALQMCTVAGIETGLGFTETKNVSDAAGQRQR
ncbi:uncharacterized protein MAM_03549 [Metarhizium album ARSEF 1941]|uniref:Uncharacterized protein n=1 Tax=Metarhizium album (strain ARSEF 1941) TaxID=1081103 RepID=A0A0B2X013_METAS|nr:uncharacterized protein MAM_03549 [Metarhizium album ARSEF 1941]KHN98425.1 hypothetical protein MAM_03549 [Metarhizium album ARSEF 1941]